MTLMFRDDIKLMVCSMVGILGELHRSTTDRWVLRRVRLWKQNFYDYLKFPETWTAVKKGLNCYHLLSTPSSPIVRAVKDAYTSG